MFPIVQKSAEFEHAGPKRALRIGECGACVEKVQLHLKQIITRYMPHLPLLYCHAVEFLGIGEVGEGYRMVFARHQQREE